MFNKMIILVDDVADIRHLLKIILERECFRVKLFQSARLAIDFIDKQHEDIGLILTDLFMPDLNGFDFLVEIKNRGKSRGIPFIFVSSSNDDSDISKAFQLGAIDFISKPFNEKLFLQKIVSVTNMFSETHKRANTVLEGSLKTRNVHSLIFICESERLNGFLKITRTENYFGIIKFEKGEANEIAIFDLLNSDIVSGTDALDKIVHWDDGKFLIRKGSTEEYNDIFPAGGL